MPTYGGYNNPGAIAQPRMQTSMDLSLNQNVPTLSTILVNNEEEVEMYPLGPNATVIFMCFSSGKFWIKSKGMNGVPQPTRSFTFEEIAPAKEQNNYVSKQEFSDLSAKLDKLIAELGGAKT